MKDEYIVIDKLSKLYPYHVNNNQFTSNINLATIRTYSKCKEVINTFIVMEYYKNLAKKELKIVSARKIKLEKLKNK
jgi:hypothetical protein